MIKAKFKVGDMVRYLSPYGETRNPQVWDAQPYEIVGISQHFNWVSYDYLTVYSIEEYHSPRRYGKNVAERQLELWPKVRGEEIKDIAAAHGFTPVTAEKAQENLDRETTP